MVEDVARVVDVEKVLRRLRDRGLRIVLEVRQHVLQEVGMRLHVGVEDHDDVVVLGRLLGEAAVAKQWIELRNEFNNPKKKALNTVQSQSIAETEYPLATPL